MCTRALARLCGWDCWVAPHTYELILCLWCQLWCVLWQRGERDKDRMLASFIFHIWFDVCLWGSQLCSNVRCLRLWMLDEQRATESWGAGTSANKEYWKSKAASNSSCIFLERDPCLRRATNSCNQSRAGQTDGYSISFSSLPKHKWTWSEEHFLTNCWCTVTHYW